MEEEEGSVMLTIVPNEDGEMVAVPVRVQQQPTGEDGDMDEDGSKAMEVHMEGADAADFQVCVPLKFSVRRSAVLTFFLMFCNAGRTRGAGITVDY